MEEKRLKLSTIISYALGQLGWSMLMGIINIYLVWFYLAPKEANLPKYIPQGNVLGFLTVIGLITMAGRFLDAITDPWIANLSDKSKSKYGRRISFMMKSAVPLAIFTTLVFYSPVNSISLINVIFLIITLFSFYIFYTMYVTPYFALLSELGQNSNDKINLSTAISVTFFIGTAFAFFAPSFWGIFIANGMEKVLAIRLTIGLMALVALVFLFIPVFTIDEKKYSDNKPSGQNMLESIKSTFSNKNFLMFTISDLMYFTALTVFQTGLIYYTTVLMRLPESMMGILNMMLVVFSFIFYPFVNILAKKIGKKKMLVFAFFNLMITYLYIYFLGMEFLPVSTKVQAYILVIVTSLPMAIFGILPNVVVADIAADDAEKTGQRNEAMFFGVRTFMSKIGQMLAMLIFSSLLVFGKDVGNDLGIRLTSPVAVIICFIGLVFFMKYKEVKTH
jgi:GPH family glycoside/pentoside/hexuronide:cation symporter